MNKKIITILSGALLAISLVGCKSTVDTEFPLPLEPVLKEALEESESFYYSKTKYSFKEEYILEHNSEYNKKEDNYYITIVVDDKAYEDQRSIADVAKDFEEDRFRGGRFPTITGFEGNYRIALEDYCEENDLKGINIVIEIYNESDDLLLKDSFEIYDMTGQDVFEL